MTQNPDSPFSRQNDLTKVDSAEVFQDGQESTFRFILQQQGMLLGKHDQLLRSLTSDNQQILQQVSHPTSLVTQLSSPVKGSDLHLLLNSLQSRLPWKLRPNRSPMN